MLQKQERALVDQKFHIEADPNSPIWGSGNHIAAWLAQWHADGCPTLRDTVEPVNITRIQEIEAKEERRRARRLERAAAKSEKQKVPAVQRAAVT
jgi:hypothetical protein